MSVINQMLRDLEQNKNAPTGQAAQVANVAAPVRTGSPVKTVALVALVGTLLVAGGWWLVHNAISSQQIPSKEARAASEVKAVTATKKAAAPVPAKPRPEATSSPVTAEAKLASEKKTTTLDSLSANRSEVSEEASETRAHKKQQPTTSSVVETAASKPRSQPDMTGQVSDATTPLKQNTPQISKIQLTPHARAEALWRQARRQPEQANALLRQALALDPGLDKARVELVVMLVQAGRTEEAEAVVDAGLTGAHPSPTVVEWKARLALARGDVSTALRWLRSQKPPLPEQPSYYGLTASLLARTDNHAEAAQLYERLLQIEPDQGRWWLGLALSREKMGLGAQALTAYRKALSSSGLSRQARAFAQQKLAKLSTENNHGK